MKSSKLVAAALVCACGGCAEVLSIDDAELDPSLEAPQTIVPTDGGDDASDGSGSDAALGLCDEYCNMVMDACSGAFAVYAALETCLAVCAHLPEGRPGDEIGNTVHCRLRAARTARTEPVYYCPIAGPGGAGTCGTSCESLCVLDERVCAEEPRPWSGPIACKTECDALADLGTFSTDQSAGMYRGDHVQCRLFHLSAAATEDPGVHCRHVAGDPPCSAAE